MHADEVLTAFLELESASLRRIALTRPRDFSKLGAHADLNHAEDISPPGFFASSRPAIAESTLAGENRKEIFPCTD
jgi:hypothetical protein